MYAGSTLRQLRTLDMWFGAHQKIDRLARRRLALHVPTSTSLQFPSSKHILQFEGIDGPDGIKRKTPAQDEPWHFYDPKDPTDDRILAEIQKYYKELVKALIKDDQTKASFAAAWLAHAVVDGLTPAHQYPYEQELIRLRGGKGIETRTSPKEKLVMPGDTFRKKLRNNWQMWGDKGLLATHLAFEWGVAAAIIPYRAPDTTFDDNLLQVVQSGEIIPLFEAQARTVADMNLYEQFYDSGWTPRLARRIRRELIPLIIDTVTCVWFAALTEAEREKRS